MSRFMFVSAMNISSSMLPNNSSTSNIILVESDSSVFLTIGYLLIKLNIG